MPNPTSVLAIAAAISIGAATAAAAPPKPRKVAIVVYEGAEILDFAGPTEVLAAASSFAGSPGQPAMEIYTVAKSTAPIKSQGIVTIVPQYSIDNAPRPDFVIIPGGNSDAISSDPATMKWLASVTTSNEVTLTVCTGAFPLAKLGQLDNLEVTTWFGAIDNLRTLAPKAKVTHGRRFVDNGKLVTTAGVSAGIDGALHLVARTYGRRVADQTARYMEYHWTPEPYLAKTYAYWNPSTDDRGRALQAAHADLEEGRTVQGLAALEKLAPGDPTGATWLAIGDARFARKDFARAVDAYAKVPASSKSHKVAVYNLACSYALLGKKREALAAVHKAFAAGITRDYALADRDLAAIHDELRKGG